MKRKYVNDLFDGREVPPLVITNDYTLRGTHEGSVHVEGGTFVLEGTLQGSLDIQGEATAIIIGTQQGSISISAGAQVTVRGAIQGSMAVENGAKLIAEECGTLAGSLSNSGTVVVQGVFGCTRTGSGEFRLEGSGSIKIPVTNNGISYYEG